MLVDKCYSQPSLEKLHFVAGGSEYRLTSAQGAETMSQMSSQS